MRDLKNLSQEEKQKLVDQINTEVISVASEEKRTGVKIPVPAVDELVAKASVSLIQQRRVANQLMPAMSKRALIRAFNAILDLPTDGVPVFLKGDDEKQLFAAGQKAIFDRYVILSHYIKQEALKDKQQAEVSSNETN